MSYALDFAPEARVAWRGLVVAIQEAVLDELDRLADHPLDVPRGVAVRDIVLDVSNTRRCVFG